MCVQSKLNIEKEKEKLTGFEKAYVSFFVG